MPSYTEMSHNETCHNLAKHAGGYSGMMECFVNCFLKALVEIVDCQGLGEFAWEFGPSTEICLIDIGPLMYLHVLSCNVSSTAS